MSFDSFITSLLLLPLGRLRHGR